MNPNPKAKPELPTESGRSPTAGKFKRFFVLILSLIIIGLAVFLSLKAWDFNERHPRTDDAVSRANIIGIAPRVSGPIIKINVTDNQFVKGGDLLFEIDPADFQLNVDRAKSALDALDQQIETGKSQDAQIKFQAKAAEAAVRQATAERDQAADTLSRLEPLLPKGYATKEQVFEFKPPPQAYD
jgi:membrane fusion protein, multidrug efflux system